MVIKVDKTYDPLCPNAIERKKCKYFQYVFRDGTYGHCLCEILWDKGYCVDYRPLLCDPGKEWIDLEEQVYFGRTPIFIAKYRNVTDADQSDIVFNSIKPLVYSPKIL